MVLEHQTLVNDIYIQNEKRIKSYCDHLRFNELPITRGHLLTHTDKILKKLIMNLMCNFFTKFNQEDKEAVQAINDVNIRLTEMKNDGLLSLFDKGILLPQKSESHLFEIHTWILTNDHYSTDLRQAYLVKKFNDTSDRLQKIVYRITIILPQ